MDRKLKIQVSTGGIFFLAAALLILPLQWVVAMVLAAIVHECSHAVAILLLGGEIRNIHIGGRGAVMEACSLYGIREIICALAGPIGSILLLTVAPRFPRLAICGLIHGAYNLLPLFPMDGGRVLRCILFALFRPPIAGKILTCIQFGVIAAAFICSVILSLRIGFIPILFWFVILQNNIRENPLAKMPFWRYNRGTID